MVGHLAEDEPGKRLKGARRGFQALLNLLPVKPLKGNASLDFASQSLIVRWQCKNWRPRGT